MIIDSMSDVSALTDSKTKLIDPLRYPSTQPARHSTGNQKSDTHRASSEEIAFLRLRYKQPDAETSQLIETPIHRAQITATLTATSPQYQFAASVAAFGQLLRGGEYTTAFNLNDVLQLARQAKGNDPFGYRSEFIQLVNLATSLTPASTPSLSKVTLE